MTTYAVTTPKSESDSNYARFEYMLGWFDYNGTWQQKLFTDWANVADFKNEVFNENKNSSIGSITKTETNRLILSVEDATIDDIKVYLSIFRAEKVYRIFKDGTSENLAPDSKLLEYRQRGLRYQFSFELVASDSINLNVPI